MVMKTTVEATCFAIFHPIIWHFKNLLEGIHCFNQIDSFHMIAPQSLGVSGMLNKGSLCFFFQCLMDALGLIDHWQWVEFCSQHSQVLYQLFENESFHLNFCQMENKRDRVHGLWKNKNGHIHGHSVQTVIVISINKIGLKSKWNYAKIARDIHSESFQK